MINLNLLRDNTEFVIKNINKKDPNFDINALIDLDKKVREIKLEIEELRHKKNELAKVGSKGISSEVIEQSKKIGATLKEKEKNLSLYSDKFNILYLSCPNLISDDIPEGREENNKLIRLVGDKPNFSFEPKDHVELGSLNSWFNFEVASKIAGSQFAFYKGDVVKIVYSLMMYMFNNNLKHGYYPVFPPFLVNEESLIGASNFPRFKDQVYAIEKDNLYLTPTSEVNLTAIYRDHIFMADHLPVRMTSLTSCFRREAGGYGSAERGLIRLHQFEKLELYSICRPEKSGEEQEKMIECAESILKSLGLHYRIMLLAAQDTSFASSKTYDIEVWLPSQKIYKEVSSISNCTDYQARRSKIRYRKSAGEKTQFVNTLNGSSLAIPRLLVALMETYQNEDGSISLPDALKQVSLFL